MRHGKIGGMRVAPGKPQRTVHHPYPVSNFRRAWALPPPYSTTARMSPWRTMVYSSPSLPGALRPPGAPDFFLRLTEVNPVSLRRFHAAPSEDGAPKWTAGLGASAALLHHRQNVALADDGVLLAVPPRGASPPGGPRFFLAADGSESRQPSALSRRPI